VCILTGLEMMDFTAVLFEGARLANDEAAENPKSENNVRNLSKRQGTK
jgi:hypothetical protein